MRLRGSDSEVHWQTRRSTDVPGCPASRTALRPPRPESGPGLPCPGGGPAGGRPGCEQGKLIMTPLATGRRVDESVTVTVTSPGRVPNLKFLGSIWILGDLRCRRSDLRYRHITILQLKRLISSDLRYRDTILQLDIECLEFEIECSKSGKHRM
jgi:hypothetical protein